MDGFALLGELMVGGLARLCPIHFHKSVYAETAQIFPAILVPGIAWGSLYGAYGELGCEAGARVVAVSQVRRAKAFLGICKTLQVSRSAKFCGSSGVAP